MFQQQHAHIESTDLWLLPHQTLLSPGKTWQQRFIASVWIWSSGDNFVAVSHHVSSAASGFTRAHLPAAKASSGLNQLLQSPISTLRWSVSCRKVSQSPTPAFFYPSALLRFGAAALASPHRGGTAGWWDTHWCHQPPADSLCPPQRVAVI